MIRAAALETLAQQYEETDRMAREGIAHVPSPATIGAYVRLQREMAGWKQQALAYLADVSLSTIERIERGEAVLAESLDRVAAALHLPPGSFTRARVPLGIEPAASALAESLARSNGTPSWYA
jgi:DNA-binding XRE family transcriptional regulator